MLLPSYLQNWERSAPVAPRRTQTSPRKRASFGSQLEALENRQLFSTFTVTSLQDSGAGSLRAEIAAAQSGDTIVFAPTLSTSSTLSSSPVKSSSSKKGHGKPTPPPPPAPPPTPTITLTSGELRVAKNLTIQGPGAGQLILSGSGSRALEVAQASALTLSGLMISGGSISANVYPVVSPWAGYGGGILNHGTLTASACTISGTVSGQLSEGGGIFNFGSLILSDSTVSGCYAVGSDAGATGASGAGISNAGTATLTNSVISNNSATVDATLSYPWFNKGGGIMNHATMILTGCTVSNNYARNSGGGIFNEGTLILNGSNVSNNFAYSGFDLYNAGTATIRNFSTITGNLYGPAYEPGDVYNVGVLNLDKTSTIGTLLGNPAVLI